MEYERTFLSTGRALGKVADCWDYFLRMLEKDSLTTSISLSNLDLMRLLMMGFLL